MHDAIVIFGKTARAGNVKTRLSPPLEPAQAARLYDAFARDVMDTVHRYRASMASQQDHLDVTLAWDGRRDDDLAVYADQQLNFDVTEQRPGKLGARLQGVFSDLRDEGARRVMAVGTDSPTLSPEHLRTARMTLESHDVVFGPAFDGGYYLVGVDETDGAKPMPETVIFEDISWSSPRVLEQSWQRATDGGLLCELLGFWYDIDTYEDLLKARFHLMSYLADREPQVGRHTRQALESLSVIEQHEG